VESFAKHRWEPIRESDAMTQPFNFAGIPRLIFGPGKIDEAANIIRGFGERVLIVTGGSSFQNSRAWDRLIESLRVGSIRHFHASIQGEPSPDVVDSTVAEFKNENIDAVLACGGGSVVDAGKAISAMLKMNESVVDYLEGVGTGTAHDGSKIPFIAVPTTAGTGSEATKNAVLSRIGPGGFKKSLRHENFVPDVAILDPLLALSCPPDVTAACGLDALTQLLESYVSTQASPMTDTLALSGIEHIGKCLVSACTTGADDPNIRAGMAYAAFLSGVTLANAGLGVVHGLASPIGGLFEIPHGVVCGTLIGAATSITIDKLTKEDPAHPALEKYARAGSLLFNVEERDVAKGCKALAEELNALIEQLNIARLRAYGIQDADLENIASLAGNKNNPASLSQSEMVELLQLRL
jgi:alcohol dehydrogenase class IV